MRRKDREVLDETKIDEFIRNCDCCRIGFYDKVGKMACNYSERFQCVMGTGLISFVKDNEEKAMALNEIMFQNMGKKDWEFPEAMLNGVAVFKIEVTSLSCKEHL